MPTTTSCPQVIDAATDGLSLNLCGRALPCDRHRWTSWHLAGVPFDSPFDGDCPLCPDPIRKTQPVTRQVLGDGTDRLERYVHVECC